MRIGLTEPVFRVEEATVDGLQIPLPKGTSHLGPECCPYRDHAGGDESVYRLRLALEAGPVSSGYGEFTLSALG
jgi:hypothetical protein